MDVAFQSTLRCGSKKEDRAGLERLVRYCAPTAFASEKLTWLRDGQLSYRLPKPTLSGRFREGQMPA